MTLFRTMLFAATAVAASAAIPAQAQVAGIATADSTDAIMQAKAFSQAYQTIGTTFTSNAQLIQTKRKEINDINAQLDTNKDKTLTQEELDAAVKAKNPLIGQIDAKEKEIAQLQDPIVKAQAFAVESIADRYAAAQQAVVTAKKINMILSPDAFIWAPDAVDITSAITAEIDKAVPTVGITPPANWQPKGSTGPLYEQVQQRLLQAARVQAIRNAQAQQAAQPGQPAPQPGQPAPAPAPQPEPR
ncbi:OmpH family outer membrane protein [Sphingorhabdus sp.]|jgi:Skp family chaperone for outer membrane proteins|uniref:OmpH family outer membrane protein n=1 Tax=Sphingorhabdus sp. TaxID=1902408 RepID=UPI003BAFB8EE|nr:OmpH family outer membrane protein [Sphingomonadales bacterium]MBK9433203.1 OmpH family outer membrane protein [Sphingomonadales bacterium]MBL0022266.1 OmpH family outer membrane protein [Sphingomonadales bacterium]